MYSGSWIQSHIKPSYDPSDSPATLRSLTPNEEEIAIDTPPDSEAGDAPEVVPTPAIQDALSHQHTPKKPDDQRYFHPDDPEIILPGLRIPPRPKEPQPGLELGVASGDRTTETPGPPQLRNFVLPVLKLTGQVKKFVSQEGVTQHFSIKRLTWALQNNLTPSSLIDYLSYFEAGAIAKAINQDVEMVPSIFYAVSTNDENIVRTWIEHGGEVNAIERRFGLPLLVFAILNADTIREDTTAIVRTLLSLGADVSVIPKAFYSPFLRDLPTLGPSVEELCDIQDENKRWCNEFIRPQLAHAMNFSQRYFLEKSSNSKQPSVRFRQAAAKHNVTPLLGVSFFMIGQHIAIKLLVEKLLSHLVIPNQKPLVLMFAGPSGHGKTEMGRRLGDLMSLDIQTIDMAEIRHETDLFGPKAPYIGSERGSPLNNFLARMTGKRAIVLLDEFEKSTQEVQHSLLVPFDEGKFMDRRTRQQLDCSKIIWILASNALDPIIMEFDKSNRNLPLGNDSEAAAITNRLQPLLTKGLKAKFGFPLSGRISSIIPFMPFSPCEQAIMAHQYLLRFAQNIRGPISLSGHLVGNVVLHVRREVAVCEALAKDYDPDMGARSLESAVKSRVEELLVQRYLEGHCAIDEGQPLEEYWIDTDREDQILVFKHVRPV